MSSIDLSKIAEIEVDPNSLYREEIVTDLKTVTLRQLLPIKPDGSPDKKREPVFVAQAHLMTVSGALPIQCPIEAKSLAEALQKLPAAVKEGVDKMLEEIKEMQRQEASRIVTPGTLPGRIQMP